MKENSFSGICWIEKKDLITSWKIDVDYIMQELKPNRLQLAKLIYK